MYGHLMLPVKAKIREDRRLVASCTNLRLNIQKMLQPLPLYFRELRRSVLEAL